jgi:Ca2+-binding RTX toxin-like protein
MTTFRAGGAFAIRFDKVSLSKLVKGRLVYETDTSAKIETGENSYVTFNGHNIDDDDYDKGVVTNFTEVLHGLKHYSFTNMKVSLALLGGRMVARDGDGFMSLLLAKNDQMYGSRYNDYLKGYAGKDLLKSGGGNDSLAGGDGSDTLYGGAGEDTFIFNVKDGGVDRIADFSSRSDKIHIDWAGGRSGVGLSKFVYGSQALDAEDRVIYDKASGRVYFDPDGTGYKPQILLAKVKAGLALTDDNFLLI